MKWDDFVKRVGDLPVIMTEHLFIGSKSPSTIAVQINRWLDAGKLIQLKRGVYVLAKEYIRVDFCEPYVASILKKPSYISLEKALEYHNLIPEAVPVYTSVTTKRPARFATKLGVFTYRHIRKTRFWGYDSMTIGKQTAFMATPEKALLDFLYFQTAEITVDYLNGLRLQNLDILNEDKLCEYAHRFKKKKIIKASELITKYMNAFKKGERYL